MDWDWMPIETAPRDGTRFLTTGVCGFNLVFYQSRPYRSARRWFIVEEQGAVGSYDTLEERFCTHWMPLPNPPA